MKARPFTPEMGRRRPPVHGGTQALAAAAVVVTSAWGGQHGLGVYVGWAGVAALVVWTIAGFSWAAGWCVRQIRAEIEAQR